MSHVRAPVVICLSAAFALIAAGVIGYPLAVDFYVAKKRDRAESRSFVVASPTDQKMIVRGILLAEQAQPPLCNPTDGTCPEEPIYLDRRSAVMRSFDDPAPWMEYELRSIGREQSLIDRGDGSTPPQLLELLGRLVQDQTETVDPDLAGMTYVAHATALPDLGGNESQGSCTDRIRPRLIRVSRAAVHQPEKIAIAYVTTTYCGGGSWGRIVKLERSDTGWRLLTPAQQGP